MEVWNTYQETGVPPERYLKCGRGGKLLSPHWGTCSDHFAPKQNQEICVTFLTPFTWEILGLGWKGSGLPCLGSLANILCFLWQDYAPPLHPNHCLACLGKLSLRSWISPSAHSVLKRAQVPPKLNTWAVNDLSVFSSRHRLDSFGLASGRKVPHPRPPKPLEGDEPTTRIHGMFLLCLKELFTDIEPASWCASCAASHMAFPSPRQHF